jgi:hypothetical protein
MNENVSESLKTTASYGFIMCMFRKLSSTERKIN